MKKKFFCCVLSIMAIVSLMAIPASAASATLSNGSVSAWSGQITDRKSIKLDSATNYASSKRNVYFDLKYYDGKNWVKDKCAANLDPNRSINSPVSSTTKGANMSWILQINTWNCWYSDCSAYGNIV